MPEGVTGGRSTFLSTAPAEREARRLALVVVLISLLVFLAVAPFAGVPLPQVWAFIPAYESALAINDLITASLLFAQFSISRSRALLVLACGYLFTTVMVVPHALTFPGLFSPTGLLGAGSQSTAWLYMFWHGGFPIFVIAYALVERPARETVRPHQSSRALILCSIAAVLGVGCALTLLATAGHDLLPVLLRGGRYTPVMMVVNTSVWALSPIALAVLWRRRPHSMLDLWLMVVMCAWLFDVALSTVLNAARFDLGFYAGRIYGLLAATFVLVALLRGTWMLYAGIVQLLEAEQRERRRDIAERRRLFETSLDLILVVDRKGTIGRVNPRSMPIIGYTPEEMIGRTAAEFLDPKDLDNSRVEMRKARRGGIIRDFECRYIHKDGHPVTLTWTGLWSEPDKQYFFFGRDMTEQRLSEEKFRLAVESSPSGMIMIDAAGTIEMVNAETERLFGYRREELVGQSVDLVLPPRSGAGHQQQHARSLNHTDVRHIGTRRDLFGLRKDGTEFSVEVGLNSIETSGGLVVLGTVVDISERKRVERLKDEFVSTVSHELRTPLTSIAASLGLLAGGAVAKLPENVGRLIGIAHANSRRLVRLINDILDIEKIESGKIVFHLGRVDVRALIERAIEANREFAEGVGVRLRLDPGSGESDVTADSDRLTQVVTNLISNAVKFSPAGEEVVVRIEPRDGTIRITVRDHGPGIPDHFKPRIFEKFAQADATDARQKGGTGLGLSIVKQIVTRLDGKVGFNDAPTGGTIFYADLPRWKPPVGGEFSPGPGQRHARLLICDDYPPAANLLAGQLGNVGFICDIATTGAEAAERAATAHYAAILIDLQLPDCDGISLIQQLRAQPQNQDTPIVVVSADPDRGRDDTRSTSLDVLDWFQKPVDIDRLARLINRPVAGDAGPRPRILHVDDDPDVLRAIRRSLSDAADWVSVESIDAARRALAVYHFDLAIINIALAAGSGLDLLPDLQDSEGNAIPVIVLSAQGANPTCAAQVQAALTKSHASIDQLVATLRRRVESKASTLHKEKETT